MELKKHFNPRVAFFVVYFVAFAIYIIVGLQPVKASTDFADEILSIPSIGLVSEVIKLQLNDNRLDTPDTIAGSFTRNINKTLLIGHSSTVFVNLKNIPLRDKIEYAGKTFRVIRRDTVPKNTISMSHLLKEESVDTLVIMTCAGKNLGGGDASHRLIITALAE